jgi:hypothetical protein
MISLGKPTTTGCTRPKARKRGPEARQPGKTDRVESSPPQVHSTSAASLQCGDCSLRRVCPSLARPHSTLRSPLLSASGPLDTLRAALLHSCNCSLLWVNQPGPAVCFKEAPQPSALCDLTSHSCTQCDHSLLGGGSLHTWDTTRFPPARFTSTSASLISRNKLVIRVYRN